MDKRVIQVAARLSEDELAMVERLLDYYEIGASPLIRRLLRREYNHVFNEKENQETDKLNRIQKILNE